MNPSELPDETLFEGALECRTPAERAAFLNRACAGQPELRRKLEALLAAHEQAGEFLEPAATPRPTIQVELAPEETPGTMIGRYKLLQKIGEGGMGAVYMAEQTAPVVRKVALKIIKLGMDTREVVARFEAERQALALMDHPNIAKVLDAGATEAGRPYFVMELVRGVAITEYCDKNKLSTRQRLELFIPVCQAIQHAHQKGIIHRDIKPSNVMVTLHDGQPVPRVIDFGIAKATNQRLTEKTLFTNYAQMIGTPAYMSPEQAEMSGLDIDTRTDVYSLGVLLYELLTGTTPFNAKELLNKGYAEMQRVIVQEEPPKPSTRMSTMQNEERTVVASNRSMEASALRKVFEGDLDWIVMKCLEKDRTRRYETSNGLAADLLRHLSNELITARPPTTGYLLAKLIKRNKLAFAASGAVAAALVIGIATSTWQAIRANREASRAVSSETLARQRLSESEAITKFLTEVFQSPDPARDGRTITVAESLHVAVQKLETELADQPARRAALHSTIGATYRALGLYREAIALQEQALEYHRSNSGPEHPDTLEAMRALASHYYTGGRATEALKLSEEALMLCRKALRPDESLKLRIMQNLAVSYHRVGRLDEALHLQEQVLPQCRIVNGPEHPLTLRAMQALAHFYDEAGRVAEAFQLRQDVLALRRKVLGSKNPETLEAMRYLAFSYFRAGRKREALAMREEWLEISRSVNGPEHSETLAAISHLATSYWDANRQSEAIKLREEWVAVCRKVNGLRHSETLKATVSLGDSYLSTGRVTEGLTMLNAASTANPADTFFAMQLAALQVWFGKDADHTATCERMINWSAGTDRPSNAERVAKIICLRPIANPPMEEAALALAQQAVELGRTNLFLPWYQLTLGMAGYRSGKFAIADEALTAAALSAPGANLNDRPRIEITSGFYRAMSLFQQGKLSEARAHFAESEAKMKPLPADDNYPLTNGADCNDLILWLTYKEAKALLNEPRTAHP